MGRYRKKETVVEAERFSAKTFDVFSKFCPAAKGMYYDEVKGAYYIIVPALTEDHRADEGDYIIKSMIGEFYPCKPDVFEILYEKDCKALGDGNRELYRAALDTFGDEAQIKMLFEEVGELMTAICQYSRGRDERAHVAEEIADVRIMIDQMAVLFDCENEVERQKRYKLKRLEERIVKAKFERNLRVFESNLRVNTPLTFEELEDLLGEPVWIVDKFEGGGCRWAIVSESLLGLFGGYTAYRNKVEVQNDG